MIRIAYVGIDLLDEVLKTLLANPLAKIIKIFTCDTGNKTEFNTEVIQLARDNNIPFSIGKITPNDLTLLWDQGCDLLICAGYYYKIPTCDNFPMVNYHPALLPVGRGPWPMPLTILKGYRESGVTIHKIASGFDSGDIVLQKSIEVSEDENLVSLMQKYNAAAKEMTDEFILDYKTLCENAIAQDIGEYWDNPTEEMYTVTVDMSFEDIELTLRSFYGYEIYYMDGQDKYELIFAEISKNKPLNKQYFITKDGAYITAASITKI